MPLPVFNVSLAGKHRRTLNLNKRGSVEWYDGIKRLVFIHVTGQLKILCLHEFWRVALGIFFCATKFVTGNLLVSRLPVLAL